MLTSLLIEIMFGVMRKEHRFYQKWLVDNNYFMQSQKWFVCNPLMGCRLHTVKHKIVQHERISK